MSVPVEGIAAPAPQSDGPPQLQQQVESQSQPKWPGWPGDNVFRLIVPVTKVGSIIGRKGELIKKMCDETRARIRILEGPPSTSDRIVSFSLSSFPFSLFFMLLFSKPLFYLLIISVLALNFQITDFSTVLSCCLSHHTIPYLLILILYLTKTGILIQRCI